MRFRDSRVGLLLHEGHGFPGWGPWSLEMGAEVLGVCWAGASQIPFPITSLNF